MGGQPYGQLPLHLFPLWLSGVFIGLKGIGIPGVEYRIALSVLILGFS